MKRILTVLAILISVNSFGQLGFKGGVLSSQFSSTGNYKTAVTRYTGFSVGVFYSLKITEKVYFQPEANFSKRGYKDNLVFTDQMGNPITKGNEFVYSYIDVPLLLRLQSGTKIKPYILAGPAPTFGNGFTLTGIAAAGIDIPVKEHSFLIELRYIKAITKNEFINSQFYPTYYNSSYGLLVGFTF